MKHSVIGNGPEGQLHYQWVSPQEAIDLLNQTAVSTYTENMNRMAKHAVYVIQTHLL